MIIPRRQLEDLGFKEIKKDLFMKDLGHDIQLYRDYRENSTSYAYRGNRNIPINNFKEFKAIAKIENYLLAGDLSSY